jgi:glycosyltransferase involved in cell wall biosynthesis
MRILFLGDNLANAKQWCNAMEDFSDIEIEQWGFETNNRFYRLIKWIYLSIFGKSYFKKYNVDLVIGYRTTSYGFIAARSGIRPLVVAAQGENDVWPLTGIQVPIKNFLRNYSCRKADLIHAWGEHMKTSILETGADAAKIVVRPRGIDLNMFNCSDKKNKVGGTWRFVSTRSLYPEYNYELIIRTFYLLHKEGIDFEYRIIGDGILRKELKKIVEELGLLGKVIFLGRKENEDLPEYLSQSDIYISMPVTEGISASLFEALACGCYLILSDLKASRAFITNEENGLLVRNFEIDELYKVIHQAIDNPEIISKSIHRNRQIVNEIANLKENILFFRDKYINLIKQIK